MNSKEHFLRFLLLIVFLFLTSCSPAEPPTPIDIEPDYVNQQILIRAPAYANSFSPKDPIILELKYNSENEIIFPNNYNLKIFKNADGKWIEIEEKPIERYPHGNIVLSPENTMQVVYALGAHPKLLFFSEEYSLRIYVVGEMKVNGEVLQVAAYTDVMLSP
jgi:hypothetical protein